ncbi:hypothetical protein [Mycolicibacterium rutilum]|nr:hypothetical protein [Mycolicibacterium rutilum]
MTETANNRKDHAKTAGQKIACGFWLLRLASKSHPVGDVLVRKEGADVMNCNSAFTGVAVAGMSRTLHVAAAAVAARPAAAAHPAHAAAGVAAAITPQRKRRTAAATATSVDRGTI